MEQNIQYGTPAHAQKILEGLEILYPDAGCALNHLSALQLLIAVILSAQCTDVRVNFVTKDLFKKYRCAADYANASQEELEADIHSTGFYHNKAKNIRECCRILVEKYGGEVPDSMDELVQLPGVGRKTANCVLGTFWGIADGVVVDTHVLRLAQRMGLSEETTPEKVEQDLMRIVPQDKWVKISHQLILHGRNVCMARNPQCEKCLFND
ncbi:MAG: endonuclease III [Thermoguttaceae bacterium]|nr:endonuclease III [Thermoguttaceae bacterium]MBR0191239.1 endonuclease III [Thermoguttaceae bacterium]